MTIQIGDKSRGLSADNQVAGRTGWELLKKTKGKARSAVAVLIENTHPYFVHWHAQLIRHHAHSCAIALVGL